MLFSPKTKGYFIEQTEHAWFMARTSATGIPCVLEELKEVKGDDGSIRRRSSQTHSAG